MSTLRKQRRFLRRRLAKDALASVRSAVERGERNMTGTAGGKERGPFRHEARHGIRLSPVVSLALVVALTLSGCGGTPDISGDWSGQMDFEEGGSDTSAELDLSLEHDEDGAITGTGTMTVRTPTETEETELEQVGGRVQDDGTLRLEAVGGDFASSSGVRMRGEAGEDSMEGDARLFSEGTLEGILSDEEPEQIEGTYDLERQE